MSGQPLASPRRAERVWERRWSLSLRARAAAPAIGGAAIVAGFLVTAARGLRFAHDYGLAHWLHHYEFGFVTRGLPGALVRPFLLGKAPQEVRDVLNWTTALCYFLFAAACLWLVKDVRRHASEQSQSAVAWTSAALFVCSGFVVSTSNFVGYFDQLLVLSAIVSVRLIARGAYLPMCLLTTLTFTVHEAFLALGFPAVCLALVFREYQRRGRFWQSLVSGLKWIAVPLAAAVFVLGYHTVANDPALALKLQASMNASGAIDPYWSRSGVYHLQVTLTESAAIQQGQLTKNLTNFDMNLAVIPTLALQLLLGGWLMSSAGARTLIPLYVAALVVPYALVPMAADWHRFIPFTVCQGFLALSALLMLGRFKRPFPARALPGLVFAACVAVGSAHAAEMPLTLAFRDGQGPFSRLAAVKHRCSKQLFPNSDFSDGSLKNWAQQGASFVGQPVAVKSRPDWLLGLDCEGYYVGSFDAVGSNAPGDWRMGSLVSKNFRIEEDEINFLLSGGMDWLRLHVILMVEGLEVRRQSGRNSNWMLTYVWDVSEYRGRNASLIVADASPDPWGHVSVAGFCYR
ncbi:MAG: hypothetical protein MJD61_02445 [Proteobacteria bacterium]|nr:hypothetical protein [Pseudomonadota bacterium]